MQTYFGYFRHAWLHTPKMIVSSCRRFQCLFACQKWSSSLTSSLRYYILKNHAIWQHFGLLLKTQNFVRYEIGGEISIISFQFRFFPRKTNDKIFEKTKKKIFRGHFRLFLPKFGQKWIFLEKNLCQFLNIPIIYHDTKKSEKTNEPPLRKILNCWMDRLTDGQTMEVL